MVTVTLAKRMRKLRFLLDIRLGPGAAILPSNVKRIHLKFAVKINDGHMGPRKFWHHYLPRLKYHNPTIPMTVDRNEDQEGPASLTVTFAAPSSDPRSNAGGKKENPESAQVEESRSINMKHRKEGEILDELLKLCKGKPVFATAAEEEQLRELESERMRAEEDRVKQAQVVKTRRKQQEILNAAKQSMDTQ